MKKLAKLFSVLLMMAFLVSLVGCAAKPAPSTQPTPNNQTPAAKKKVALIVSGLGDRSFNDSGNAGIERAKKELAAKVDAKVQEAPEIASVEEHMVSYAKAGYDLIIVLSFQYKDQVKKVAPQYPKTKFMIVDDTLPDVPNVLSVLFRNYEGSFLAGALAASYSKTGSVGFIGGQDNPLIQGFEGGFVQGAKHINKDVKFQTSYVGDFRDTAKAKEFAKVMYSKGADVLFAAAGRAGAGMIDAAKEAKKFAIGVDSDQDYLAPENMIGSMLKRVDNAVFSAIKDLTDDKLQTGKTLILGVKEGGVGLCLETDPIAQKLTSKDIRDKMLAIEKDIKDGKIKIDDWQVTGRPKQ